MCYASEKETERKELSRVHLRVHRNCLSEGESLVIGSDHLGAFALVQHTVEQRHEHARFSRNVRSQIPGIACARQSHARDRIHKAYPFILGGFLKEKKGE